MGEGVLPDDGLVPLHLVAREAGHHPARAGQLFRPHIRLEPGELVAADLERHDDLLEGGIAGAFAEAVDADLDLTGTGAYPGQAVRDGEAEVVVAVGRDHVVA